MNRSLSLLLLVAATALGLTAAFFRPAVPHQIANQVPRGGALFDMELEPKTAFVDAGLDNPNVEEDGNIHPARKCGFCMG